MPNGDLPGGSDLTRLPATRDDIHRLRNEVTRIVGDVATQVRAIDHMVTKLDQQVSSGLTPIQAAQLLDLITDVKGLETETEKTKLYFTGELDGLKRRVYQAMGALAVLGPTLTIIVQDMFQRGGG